MDVRDKIEIALKEATGLENIEVVEPKNPSLGDYATNIAFSFKGKSPQKTAEEIVSRLKIDKKIFEKVIPVNGFINFYLKDSYLRKLIIEILKKGKRYGSLSIGNGKRVLVEFVSANPTGPLNIVNGRAAAVGDSLVRILNFAGYNADSEYYVNDTGRQVDLLGESLRVAKRRLKGEVVDFPENGYSGEYVINLARTIPDSKNIGREGMEKIIDDQKESLKKFGVVFNRWYRESEIRRKHYTERVIDKLKKNGHTYIKDNALWLKTEDKDFVLIKSNGDYTYLVPDLAYHIDKFDRKYSWLIDLLGPDHQGHIPPMKIGLSYCGYPQESFQVLTIQWVTVIKNNKKISMSKRKGEFITLDDLVSEAGRDVARFFFLTRKCESHLDFDFDLAKRESKENPVYYIQYAYARISSIERLARERGIPLENANLAELREEDERFIVRKLLHFPEIIELAAKNLEPHRIPFYLAQVAGLFHNFYEKHRVISNDIELSISRLNLVDAVKTVLSNGLFLMGIEAPERM